ncbi:MAG UNVERIFIED_CONTAM: pantoate--beta-alanine ligase [Planctomycetaceae bacterium]|jgi:pantoate--beta-alanine ligase
MQIYSHPSDVHAAVRSARKQGQTIGCVPTMGALHAGHASLIERARAECSCVVATIFVNPTQFGPNEDFSRYPRTLDADLDICRQAGGDIVFTPTVSDMYSPTPKPSCAVGGLSTILEGAHRPGHFDGVTTVVAKLFLITEPDRRLLRTKRLPATTHHSPHGSRPQLPRRNCHLPNHSRSRWVGHEQP